MAHEFIHNKANFWTEVKRLRQKSNFLPEIVDNANGVQPVCQLFAKKYKELYNSVSYRSCDMDCLTSRINRGVEENCQYNKCKDPQYFAIHEIRDAYKRLKP